MQTSDWAEDAHTFYIEYHERILKTLEENEKGSSISFFSKKKEDEILSHVSKNPMMRNLDFMNLQSNHPFAKLEEIRGWNVLLRRICNIPIIYDDVTDERILTLIRCNLKNDLFPQEADANIDENIDLDANELSNTMIVSRKKWALIEFLRWKKGYYHESIIKNKIMMDLNFYHPTKMKTIHYPKLVVIGSLKDHKGRSVILQTEEGEEEEIEAGKILYRTKAYCTAPMSIEVRETNVVTSNQCCFHCCRDLSNKTMTSASTVRDLSLLCTLCHNPNMAYCSVKCRQQYQNFHNRECPLIHSLLQHLPTCSDELGGMAPFKALLVLRMVLKAKYDFKSWQEIKALDIHYENHLQHKPIFFNHAKEVSKWIKDQLTIEEKQALQTDDIISTLQNLFFAININGKLFQITHFISSHLISHHIDYFIIAIGIGKEGVGMFPGIASMFNHSCCENTTHSWDEDDTDNEPRLIFRAVETISRGQECCIGYIDTLHLSTFERTQPLREHKFFDCICPRCQNEDDMEITQQWNHCSKELEKDNENIEIQMQMCEIAEYLYPLYYVTKGLYYEQLALSLSNQSRKAQAQAQAQAQTQMIGCLEKAMKQYQICRGEQSSAYQRVYKLYQTQQTKDSATYNDSTIDDYNTKEEIQENDDIVELRSWYQTLFEIKIYDSISTTTDQWIKLSKQIQQIDFQIKNCIQWEKGYRICEIGYGIQTLILCANVNEDLVSKYDISEIIQQSFEDKIQNVDVVY